ncbi:dnaJ homolog subfamily C member 9-like [Anthonomus grandis grandis]|uniref:dnaJ homolog subfamily C member 9-like n=1 Tax=Anthonomus grandis grandis TaxID=2921223 RepID=UPI002165D94E|nr:dnaJ homolog subfamily C member 9-like [Anthonomus grandis grandis]
MTSFNEKCELYFGTTDFYEVLGITKEASEKEIKKAYHKLSLLVHPDRVDEAHKEVATEKFKVLGRIHSVLQDNEKRKVYDNCGEFDEDADSTFNWKDYWLKMFRKIEISDIQKYEREYVGSETERRDIKRAYEAGKGDMNIILELVAFSSCDSEPRIIDIVREMVDNGEVPEYDGFFNESKIKKMRRLKKWEKERKEVEKIDMSELERQMQENRKRNRDSFCDLISNLEKKYAPKKAKKALTDGSTPVNRRTSKRKLRYVKKRSKSYKRHLYNPRRYKSVPDLQAYVPFIASLFF